MSNKKTNRMLRAEKVMRAPQNSGKRLRTTKMMRNKQMRKIHIFGAMVQK